MSSRQCAEGGDAISSTSRLTGKSNRQTGLGNAKKWLYAALCLAPLSVGIAQAAGVPAGFVDTQIYSGFNSPSALHTLPDGRVLVVQQDGVIRMVKNDALLSTNFYTVQNVDDFVETGCLGVTSDPGFMSNGYVYLYCTIRNGTDSHNRILRVTAVGDVAAPSSERVILDLPVIPPDPVDGTKIYTHLGGAMRFGADGKLYVATGGHENSRISPPEDSFSQKLDSPFGKILRINADGSFPSDNPYTNTPGAYQGVFNLGLRNPFGIDIQSGTGRMFINDVGAGSFEEIIDGKARENYGWPAHDGSSTDPRYTNGLYVYPHEVDSTGKFRCAVTGGAFYSPATNQFPGSFSGKYLFADFCSGSIYTLDPDNPVSDTEFATGVLGPVGLAVSPAGTLYYLARSTNTINGDGDEIGMLGKIEYTGSNTPRIAQHPQSQLVYQGDPATFSVVADGATSMQWQRNGVNVEGATSASYTLPNTTTSDSGAVYTVVTRNSYGATVSNPATLTITTNRLPQATINVPTEPGGYAKRDTLTYSATATDAEDGTLPASAFTWQANFHHDTHVHPLFPATDGVTSGSVTIPEFEATTANTWIRFMLSVRDSAGQTKAFSQDIFPRMQLSALQPAQPPVNGMGPIEKDAHNGGAAEDDGGVITLGTIPYPKGLGVHAPSDVRYDLGGTCSGNLIADVGLDGSVGSSGSVVFQVFLDGVKEFDSGLLRGNSPRMPVNVPLDGKDELRLVVTDGGNGNALDRANWAGARLTCSTLPARTMGGTSGGDGPNPGTGSGAPIATPGGGCTTGGSGKFDPTLLGLAIAAMGLLVRRRRNGNKPA